MASMQEETQAERAQVEGLRQQYEGAVRTAREDVKRVKEEWERRLRDEQLEAQRLVLEAQAKQAIHIGNLQAEYQAMMDGRLAVLQREQQVETERLRRECQELRDAFSTRIEAEYIPISKHEEIMNTELSKASDKLQD